jgi:hypothetical protein
LTVPTPVNIAHTFALSFWTSSLAYSDVIHLLSPPLRLVLPSIELATLIVINGFFSLIRLKKPLFRLTASLQECLALLQYF